MAAATAASLPPGAAASPLMACAVQAIVCYTQVRVRSARSAGPAPRLPPAGKGRGPQRARARSRRHAPPLGRCTLTPAALSGALRDPSPSQHHHPHACVPDPPSSALPTGDPVPVQAAAPAAGPGAGPAGPRPRRRRRGGCVGRGPPWLLPPRRHPGGLRGEAGVPRAGVVRVDPAAAGRPCQVSVRGCLCVGGGGGGAFARLGGAGVR